MWWRYHVRGARERWAVDASRKSALPVRTAPQQRHVRGRLATPQTVAVARSLAPPWGLPSRMMNAKPVPPSAPRPQRPVQHQAVASRSNGKSDAGPLLPATSVDPGAPAAPTIIDGDTLALTVTVARTQDSNVASTRLDQHQQLPMLTEGEPQPEPEPVHVAAEEPALVPGGRSTHASIEGAETTVSRDARLGQRIALRCISLREELSGLGIAQLRAKASAEGLAKTEVERTLESVRDFSGERPQSREGEVVAQQVLQERLVMHIAYRPVERRGKMAKEGSVRTLVRSGDSCAVCLVSHSIDLARPPSTLCSLAFCVKSLFGTQGDGLLSSAGRCQRRLFVLDSERLCYYDSNKKGPPSYRPSKAIELDEVAMVAEAPDRAEAHQRDHCFSVATPSRTFCKLGPDSICSHGSH